MDMENILFKKLPMKGIGLMEKNKVTERLFLKVAVYSKVLLKMIIKMVMEKCIITLQETISKDNGETIKNRAKVQWTGPI